jgi:hypothetical protein
MRDWRIMVIVALLGLFLACNFSTGVGGEIVEGSGNVITEDRALGDFTAVSLDGVGRLEIDQTGTDSINITGDDNILPYILTRVQDGELIISIEENVTFTNVSDLVYKVTVATIESLELNGAGEIVVSNLEGELWQVRLDGGGSITVSGEVTRQEVDLNGLGLYEARDLVSQEAVVEQDGAGSAVVNVTGTLDATIDGVGSIEYFGNPTVTQEINGLGTIKSLGE